MRRNVLLSFGRAIVMFSKVLASLRVCDRDVVSPTFTHLACVINYPWTPMALLTPFPSFSLRACHGCG